MPEKTLMKAALTRDLGVKRRAQEPTLLDRDDATIVKAGENLYMGANFVNHGRANKHRVNRRLAEHRNVESRLERVELVSERIAPHGHIEPAERLLAVDAVVHAVREHDETRARAIHRHSGTDARPQWLLQPKQAAQLVHHARLAARNDEPGDLVELGGSAHFAHVGTELSQHGDVLTHIALQRKDPDGRERTTSHAQRDGAGQEGRRR